MRIKARMGMSLDGFVATHDGVPALVRAPRLRPWPITRLPPDCDRKPRDQHRLLRHRRDGVAVLIEHPF